MSGGGVFPATASVLDPAALADRVLPRFMPEPVDACAFHTLGINDTYKVTTARRTAFLRVYRGGWRTRAEVEAELEVILRLAQAGAAVSRPIAADAGELVLELEAAEGRRYVACFEAGPGEEIAFAAYDDALARLYGRAGAALASGLPGYQDARRPPLDWDFLIEQPLRHIRAALKDAPETLSLIEAVAAEARERVQAGPGLARQFCHGDLHGLNATLQGQTLTFHDFDFCGPGWQAYEVAVFPWSLFARPGADPEALRTLGGAFLAGYGEILPIAEPDLDAVLDFIAVRVIWFVGLRARMTAYRGGAELGPPFYDFAADVLLRWRETLAGRPGREVFGL